jgi:hypothetical protein
MRITKYFCPCCFDSREEYSPACPASLHPPVSFEDEPFDGIHPSGPCAQVSGVCVWCALDDEEAKTDNVGLETMLWRRRLKGSKQRRRRRGISERKVIDAEGTSK